MLKTLWARVREYRRYAFLTPLLVSLEVVMEVLIPLFMADLIDLGIDKGDLSVIWKYGALLVACALLSLLFGTLCGRYAAVGSCGFGKNLRHDMFYKVQEFSFANIDRFSSASIVTRLTTDVTNVQQAFQMMTRIMVRAPLMLLFALVMVFTLSPQLSLIFLAILPFLGGVIFLIMRRAMPAFEKMFRTYDKLNNTVQEDLRGIRAVKSFVREDFESRKFSKVAKELYDLNCTAERTISFSMPTMQLCVYATMILVSWFGARLVVGSELTTGELTSVFSYTMQILVSLMMVAMSIVMITMSKASAERIVEVLEETPDLASPTDPVLEVKDGSITFENVDFSYSKNPDSLALSGVNLTIASGQTVGILGGTGSAKSSLVQLIPRLYDVTGGCVKVGGRDVREYDLTALRDAVAMVLQKNELFSGTIKENLRWGNPNATDEELVHACRLACADEFIQRFPDGYDTHIEQGGTNVSGGQKQRLCIARALLKQPKILILDDSTSAVDTRTDALIRQAFREEIPNTTKLIIAQRVSSVQDADQIIVLDNGRVNAVGTHEQLLAEHEIYQEVYHSQQKGGLK